MPFCDQEIQSAFFLVEFRPLTNEDCPVRFTPDSKVNERRAAVQPADPDTIRSGKPFIRSYVGAEILGPQPSLSYLAEPGLALPPLSKSPNCRQHVSTEGRDQKVACRRAARPERHLPGDPTKARLWMLEPAVQRSLMPLIATPKAPRWKSAVQTESHASSVQDFPWRRPPFSFAEFSFAQLTGTSRTGLMPDLSNTNYPIDLVALPSEAQFYWRERRHRK